MLQLVHTFSRACTTERLESTLDPFSNDWRVLPVQFMLQVVQAQVDVIQSSTPQDLKVITLHYSRPVQKRKAKAQSPDNDVGA